MGSLPSLFFSSTMMAGSFLPLLALHAESFLHEMTGPNSGELRSTSSLYPGQQGATHRETPRRDFMPDLQHMNWGRGGGERGRQEEDVWNLKWSRLSYRHCG